MHAAALRVELRTPDVHSLKEKRSVMRRLLADLRRTFGVSAAEVDFQDVWQRATIGVALVAVRHGEIVRTTQKIRSHLERQPDVEVLDIHVAFLETP